MKIVIDIPNWLYNAIMEHHEPVYSHSLGDAVRDGGVPLPKGHGKLIDANEVVLLYDSYRKGNALKGDDDAFLNAIRRTSTIIEADKAESEE